MGTYISLFFGARRRLYSRSFSITSELPLLSPTLSLRCTKVVDTLAELQFTDAEFAVAQDRSVRRVQNFRMEQPYRLAMQNAHIVSGEPSSCPFLFRIHCPLRYCYRYRLLYTHDLSL